MALYIIKSMIIPLSLNLDLFNMLVCADTLAEISIRQHLFPADRVSQRAPSTSATNQTRGSSLKGRFVDSRMSRRRINSEILCKLIQTRFHPVEYLRRTSPEHLKVSQFLQNCRSDAQLFTSLRILYLLGRSWWSIFQRQVTEELDIPCNLARDQLRVQSCSGL